MQIILLCGGSGTRLWPLSNKTRSKQFLKLFKAPDGTTESMFQRVLRQIRESKLDAEINVATANSQYDMVLAQGGKGISIITEPSRRDTFPAIALAASYLMYEKNVDTNDVVIVMPCDPYTELGYYDVILEMANAVKSRVADMVLMGIEPSEPSSKYGYIIPSATHRGMVDYFVEKPNREIATALVAKGALWNGGVFAFKLGYLQDVLKHYMAPHDFTFLKEHYGCLPKISFDYEVVEKAKSVAVVQYDGEWKDLGTWASLCKELPSSTSGNVGSHKNRATTIINELSIPIICSGCGNLIVAASPDGILVSDKEYAEDIKEYVKDMSLHPMYEERHWGTYRVVTDMRFEDSFYSFVKQVVLNPECVLNDQIYTCYDKVWIFIDGNGELTLNSKKRVVQRGNSIVIPKGTLYTLKALTKLTFIEVQLGES